MASVSIVSGLTFDVGEIAQITVRAFDNAGAPVDAVPTVSIYSPSRAAAAENPWWDGDSWEAANAGVPPSINMVAATADASLTGIYSYSFAHATAFPDSEESVIHLYFKPNGGADADSQVSTVRFRHGLSTFPVTDLQFDGITAIDTVGKLLNVLRAIHTHDQIVDDVAKELKVYTSGGEAGAAVALRFDLKDSAGLSTAREVFKRVRT